VTARGGDVLGAALLALASLLAVLALRGERESKAERPVLSRPALAFDAAARACETCHPRQTAEWRRSVMAHAADSPLFLALEMLVEEQIGRSAECPGGAGILRTPGAEVACRDPRSGRAVTGSGGEGWCVSCHAPGQNLGARAPGWSPRPSENQPLSSLLSPAGRDGVGCTGCHQMRRPHGRAPAAYEGNASWRSPETGAVFSFRPSADERRNRIANSGYALDPGVLLALAGDEPSELVPGGAHRRLSAADREYLASSELCGTCHDVRLFGTDVLGAARGDHFKRLRNGYTEWLAYRDGLRARGLVAPTCQACHLSSFPGVCVATDHGPFPPGPVSALEASSCPPGTRFSRREPGELPLALWASDSIVRRPSHPHYLTAVEVPLAPGFDLTLAAERALDPAGIPLGARARRDLLLARSLRLELGALRRSRGELEIPVTVENVGAGHRVPGGFSQERELWVHLRVSDASGRLLYEVGRIERADQDLADKRFLHVRTDDGVLDAAGRPIGLFGANVADGPDVPRWDPPPDEGGTRFRGRGLMSFQNGFLRCVRCRGVIDRAGRCEPLAGQERARADRFEDGDYDLETGVCSSNLTGREALFETYFPVGALDATRGTVRAPDAIIDTRSLAPEVPVTYVYALDAPIGAVRVEARLLFRAYPPYLLRAFAEYERRLHERGRRPTGPLLDERALERLDVVELARVEGSLG
jgi:eukaryotic-like serine/threonine-protein kinase